MPRPPRPCRRPVLRAAALLCVLVAPAVTAAPDPARLMDHVVELAGRIGPRRTGSEADRRAVDYIRGAMESAGLRVELQDVGVETGPDGARAVGSWNIVGRLEGTGPGTILVAAHHDSGGDAAPGANDNASGVAVLLETARAVAQRPRRTGYLFVSFCAEEDGLLGSRHFVRTADLAGLRAMIALELVGRGELLVGPVPRPPASWAQKALLAAGRSAKVRGVAARPLWTLAPRFIDLPFSADHEPFLEHGVPAFLMLGTYPAWTYHTSGDTVAEIDPRSLVRAAAVLDALLLDFERAAPRPVEDPHYLPLMVFGQGVLVPGKVLQGLALAALGAAAGFLLIRLRRVLRWRALGEAIRVLIVAGACTALGLVGLFGPVRLLGRIHDARFPWMAHPALHTAGAVAAALVTGWAALNLFRRIKPTVEPGPYLATALLIPAAGVALALGRGLPELGAFFAVPLLAFVLSAAVKNLGRKAALGIAGCVPFFLLAAPADYRTAVDLGGIVVPEGLKFAVLFAVVLPFVLFTAHVASFQDCLHSRFWWWVSSGRIGAAATLAALVLLGVNAVRPAYDGRMRQLVEVRHHVDLDAGRARATLRSRDRLTSVRLAGLPSARFEAGALDATVAPPLPEDAFRFDASTVPAAAAGGTVDLRATTRLVAPRAPDTVRYEFLSRSGFRLPGETSGAPRHRYTWTDIGAPPDPGREFQVLLPESGDLQLLLEARFSGDLLGLEPRGPACLFAHRGTVTATRRLFGTPAAVGASPPAGAEIDPRAAATR